MSYCRYVRDCSERQESYDARNGVPPRQVNNKSIFDKAKEAIHDLIAPLSEPEEDGGYFDEYMNCWVPGDTRPPDPSRGELNIKKTGEWYS